jgi:hypothetical protein
MKSENDKKTTRLLKPENAERITRFMLSLICFTVYLSLFVAVLANAFTPNPQYFLFN